MIHTDSIQLSTRGHADMHDLTSHVDRILREVPEEKYTEDGTLSPDGEWIKINAEDQARVRRLEDIKRTSQAGLMDQIRMSGEVETAEQAQPEDVQTQKRPRKRKLRVSAKERPKSAAVVNVVEKGVYEIDIKALLEKSPIIIQKDGSYLIHLPSLFTSAKKNE